jgi:hypothetical protein
MAMTLERGAEERDLLGGSNKILELKRQMCEDLKLIPS